MLISDATKVGTEWDIATNRWPLVVHACFKVQKQNGSLRKWLKLMSHEGH